ncbi:nucleotidyl transferase AbiEii/AbiGii toxin family protein [Luteibacter aegosomatissinici]|uniref:nucleotidyl transferase AbiEii/AbiGii toxin family protein n=1 Tax=Luteibacter aegosomatissinici TaxID=2911539 RepID=UPI001FFA34C8|nr:nucleotidyl transferase AbiEii/AbiGii toxin family protein [Luteibacter aegosomatissinici]UPG96554.1 nucleotidyl transferase AbiEii/AbiGii toxin family protein [Luteibacter aegosomatissinici]
MFERPHHQRIAHILRALDGKLLKDAKCYFGGGTAIVLQCGEYRESVDIDFLCADAAGYRSLREAIAPPTLGGLLRKAIKHARDVRTDRDKISTYIDVDGVNIRFELVREARIEFDASPLDIEGVPVLAHVDAYAEKLLANADRGMDRSTMSRDIIDLAMMIEAWGPVPRDSVIKAESAYGSSVRRAWDKSAALVSDDAYLRRSIEAMSMKDSLVAVIQENLAKPWATDV